MANTYRTAPVYWVTLWVLMAVLPLRAWCADEVVVLCPDIGETAAVFTTRDGGGGLAQRLIRAGHVVELADPWSGAVAREGGFDAVVDEVYPVIVAQAAGDGADVIWIGRGLCGLLPAAFASADVDGTPTVVAWASLGTRFDYRHAPPSHVQWLRSWSSGDAPGPAVERRALLTGLAPTRRDRRRGSELAAVEQLWRSRVAVAPPAAVVEDMLRWYETGAVARRDDGQNYLSGLEAAGQRALMIAAITDPLAPPEDVIAGLEMAQGDLSYRMLSRVNGHGEEFGHVGMMLSRAARHGVEPVVVAWLAGRRRLP